MVNIDFDIFWKFHLGEDMGLSERNKWLSGNPDFHSMKARYSEDWARARFQNVVMLMFPEIADKKVLEIGCGEGWYCKLFASMGAKEVIGIDNYEPHIKRANEEAFVAGLKNCMYRIEDANNMSFKDGYFDIALFTEGIEHYEDVDKIIKESLRVSKKVLYTFPINENPGECCPDHKHFFRKGDIYKIFDKNRVLNVTYDAKQAYVLVRGKKHV